MALAPFVGSSPACAALPFTIIEKRPTPFLAVFSLPSNPNGGSRIKDLFDIFANLFITVVDLYFQFLHQNSLK